MSWIKSASTFLDQLDSDAGQAAKEGVVTKTAEGVLERAKLGVVKTLATVEDQGIFEDSDEEAAKASDDKDQASSASAEPASTKISLPPPPQAAVRFKPTPPPVLEPVPATKTAGPSADEASTALPAPELGPAPSVVAEGAQATASSVVAAGSTSTAEPAPPAATTGSVPLETALKQELEAQSSALAQLRVSCRERDDALEALRTEYTTAVDGYEANLDEFDRERKELVRFADP